MYEIEDFISGKVKTLGWGVLNWCSTYLAHPDSDPNEGKPWTFYPEQALFILRFYAVDENGKWVYERAVLERPKKWGKSPLLASLCCVELLGPVRFSHFDDSGSPVGKRVPVPLIQIAAISEDQANNTYNCVMPMLLNGQAASVYGLTDNHVMLSKVITDSGGVIQKVTASPRGRQGQRITFAVLDETHLWIPSEHGPELYEAINNNAVGMNSRVVETTNAPVPGEGSVAEASHNAVEALQEKYEGQEPPILLDTRNVDIVDVYDESEAVPALQFVYGDSAIERGGHVDIGRIYRHICDPSTLEHSARRFFFNQRLSGKAAWLNKLVWESCRDPKKKLRRTDSIALGFKATKDSTGIVACRLDDGALFVMDYWENPGTKDWEQPHKKIDASIRKLLDDRDVALVYCEPTRWEDIIDRWHADYDIVEKFWWSSKLNNARAVEGFEAAVDEKRLSHNSDILTTHVYNAQIEEFSQGHTIRKETPKSSRHIALAQAAVLAFAAASQAIEDGYLNQPDNTLYRW